ncbi:anthranilate synthase component I family protein [Microbacterium allomyrinae]|uniref:Anthranilate synthase component I family protein n=1 Tax=Microbacterium allomyrinae TaxID=2830666 RepID=A0A9X1LUF5_9MICO|nr:anthranilate synthase component I family protein [Microbacterium allomyrinae]MCC2032254.1 anthranilate synthase component I family protein [Microbacterium allomyrinae]
MSPPLVAASCARWADPASVFFGGWDRETDVFWLDAGPDADSGWSWIGTGAPDDPDRVRSVACTRTRDVADDRPSTDAGAFRGGWIGWIGYDDAAGRAGAPAARDEDGVPRELWLRVERLLAFDHASRRVWAFGAPAEIDGLLAVVATAENVHPPSLPAIDLRAIARDREEPDAYAALIERCRDAIREGDAYQLCLTTRFAVDATIDPVEAYRRLRDTTPAHHGGFVRSGEVALVSASPERFLEIADDATTGERAVRTRPIKGTRPRGADAVSDAELEAELRASEKEQAENVMIVDLMRNDLSRVCLPGTVTVDRLLEVESYPAVHQLVSTVSGMLRPGTTVGELLDATFPAGSMTGAPKLSAMSILHSLERAPRGLFAGCFGWVGDDGALDLAMVIRSIVVHPTGAYVGAGGGITWRSDAAAEVAEVGIKARGPLAALGAALPPGW